MRQKLKKPTQFFCAPLNQRGAALIFFIFLIGLAATAIAIRSLSSASANAMQDERAAKILADAKTALIGYTLSRVGSGERPGNMPAPDRLLSPTEAPPAGGPPNYDGAIDSCNPGSGAAMNCFGRLPWQAIGMAVPSPSQNDVLGLMPWYAVSANLVDPTCMAVINPSSLSMTYTAPPPYYCANTTKLPHPWLTVRDSKGNILSNRVAVVLLLPGVTINGQSRPSLPLNGAASYLDTVVVPLICATPCVPGTYSNSDTDNDFIMASSLASASANADTNDRILYITIDELMDTLVKRAAGELRADLNTYHSANVRFPDASPLAAPLGLNNYVAVSGSDSGTAPVDVTDTITCNYIDQYNATCNVAFSLVGQVDLQRTTGFSPVWDPTASTGACNAVTTLSPPSPPYDTCRCTGAGSCFHSFSGYDSRFTCDASGACNMNLYAGVGNKAKYIYTPPVYGSLPAVAMTGSCTASGANAECTDSGTFGIQGLILPVWFTDNNWQDYFYYHKKLAADLQVGARTNIEALLIGTGDVIISAPFAASKSVVPQAQARPGAINDYLDSVENTNGDLVFDTPTIPHSASYNDQSFIVAP